jgi:hypothetical protein
MHFVRPVLAGVLALGVLTACTSAPSSPASSSAGSEAPSPSAAAVGNLPAGCEPIELRSPSGGRIDLDGIWVQDAEGNSHAMKWWLWSFGDCLWGAGRNENYSEDVAMGATADQVQAFRGTIRDDFSIEAEMVLLGPHQGVQTLIREAEVRILISIDENGGITLLEDREPGVTGPRCPSSNYCPAPLLLRPQDP